VRFERFAGANSLIRYAEGRLLVRITDLLEAAPAPVMEALAFILLAKLLRKRISAIHSHRYRLFLNRREMRQRTQMVRLERGRKLCLDPKGEVYDLEHVFEKLNQLHFHGLMARPLIGWSLRRSRTRLGHFDPSHNMIVVSRVFDQPTVPVLALEYVMFHEMLHLRFPVEHTGARRCVHTKEFKAAEQEFPNVEEAKQLLKKL
jgi:predicted metal-dependent hydrolase